MDFRGDPSAALLEVLDPEQNNAFVDHYLGVPVDLSNVMFITTANITDPILSALRDRMEIIAIPGYSEEEKFGIAQRYLIPRQLEEHGITDQHLHLTDTCVTQIISHYTKEAGVRNLERELANVMRKIAKCIAEGKIKQYRVSPKNLQQYLGVPKFIPEQEQEKDEVGVSTGLAWTETGGDVLYVEASASKGKGLLTLTGHLGEVMKESAHAALSYIRSQANQLGRDRGRFELLPASCTKSRFEDFRHVLHQDNFQSSHQMFRDILQILLIAFGNNDRLDVCPFSGQYFFL